MNFHTAEDMAPEDRLKSAKASKDELAVISNRLAVAMARREALVKSWTATASNSKPEKTQEELDAEDAALFRPEPPHLGVGAAIPAHFLVNDTERGNKSLRAKMLFTKGFKASKARNAEEKAASAKRALRAESSDEEEGRSSLGRAKKLKGQQNIAPTPIVEPQQESGSGSESDGESKYQVKAKKRKIKGIQTALAEEVNKASQEVIEKNELLSGKKKKVKISVVESNQDGGHENGKSVEPVANEQVEPSTPVDGLSSEVKRGLATPRKDDGMDAKERRRLKKKEKKKLKKLGGGRA